MTAALATAALVILLGALTYTDIRSRRLPDWLTLPLVLLGVATTALLMPEKLSAHLFAAAAGFVNLWAIAALYRRYRGFDGLGLGDAKLLAAAGAWLGPLSLAPLVLVASVSALATVGVLRLAGQPVSMHTALPFGPFLGAGFFLLWCLGLSGGMLL